MSNLLANKQYARWAFRAIVLLCCATGCGYQVWAFLSLFFTYPSVVDVDITYPETVPAPAITFCNHNGLRRRAVCEGEDGLCILSERGEEFCEENPESCKNRTFMSYYMVPDIEQLDREVSETLSDIKTYGHTVSMFKECYVSWAPDYNPCRSDHLLRTTTTGPFEVGRNCFVINSLVEKEPSPMSEIPLQTDDVGTYIRLILDLEPAQYFQTKRAVEGYFVINSPYRLENAYTVGIIIKPGIAYNIQLEVKETHLLPAPYQTNCTDYQTFWEKHNHTGPLNQQGCIDQCIIESAMTICNCTPLFLQTNVDKLNPDTRVCIRSAEEDACVNVLDISHCQPKCGKECRYLSYDFTVFESVYESPPQDNDFHDPDFGIHNLGIDLEDEEAFNLPFENMPPSYSNMFKKERFAKVMIQLKKPELVVYTQKPKFESIEVFSYVGSYLGMWLGLSLVTITDLAEDFVQYTLIPWYHLFTRKKQV